MLRKELEIGTFEDLLYHYPYRYFDRTQLTKINAINATTEYAQIAGTLINISEQGAGRGKRLVATLYDDSWRIELLWFQGAQWMKKSLRENERYIVFGKVSVFNWEYNIAHPEIELWNSETAIAGKQPAAGSDNRLTYLP